MWVALVAKRLVGLLGSAAAKSAERAVRVLMTISTLASDSTANQVAIAKTGGIPPIIVWVTNPSPPPQAQAARALFCIAADNTNTGSLIAKSNAIPPLIKLVQRGSPEGQVSRWGLQPAGWLLPDGPDALESATGICIQASPSSLLPRPPSSPLLPPFFPVLPPSFPVLAPSVPPLLPPTSPLLLQDFAARALWHLAAQAENQVTISDAGGIKPLIAMLSPREIPEKDKGRASKEEMLVEKDKGDGVAAELAALCMVRLTRITPDISAQIAEKGGIAPLVKLLADGTPGAQQQAACVLAELALVPRNRNHAGAQTQD